MKMNIDGVEWRKCDRCESWTCKIFCDCINKKINKDLKKFMNSMRKRNDHLIMISPHGKERQGMSCMNINIDKFALRGD